MRRSQDEDEEPKATKADLIAIHNRLHELSEKLRTEDKKILKLIRAENKQTFKDFGDNVENDIEAAAQTNKLQLESYCDAKFVQEKTNIQQDVTTTINSKIQNHPVLSQFATITDLNAYIDARLQAILANHPLPATTSTSSSSTIKTPFKQLKKKADYKLWSMDLANNCSVYPAFAQLVELDGNNIWTMKKVLPKNDNTKLYNAISQAVSDDLIKPIIITDPTIQQQADGLRLLDQMEDAYNKIETDYLTVDKLVSNIQTIKKNNNESNLLYLARFTKTVNELRDAVPPGDTRIPTHNMLAYYLVLGLRRPEDFQQTLIDLQQNNTAGKDFYKAGNLRYTMTKIEERINTLNIIATSIGMSQTNNKSYLHAPRTPPTNNTTSNKSGGKGKSSQGTTNQTNNNNHNNNNNNNNNNNTTKRPPTPQQSEFYNAVKMSQNIPQVVKDFNNKNTSKCYLHPEAQDNHKFHECKFVKFLLNQYQCIQCLDSITPASQSTTGASVAARRVQIPAHQYSQFQQFLNRNSDDRSQASDGISAISSEFDEEQYQSDSDNTNNTVLTYLPVYQNTRSSTSSSSTITSPSSILKSSSSYPPSSTNESSPPRSVQFSSTSIVPTTTLKHNRKVLCRARFIPSASTNLISKAVTDSGCSHHLFYDSSSFEYLVPIQSNKEDSPVALMGDDKTALAIKGYGMANISINGHRTRFMAYYVPSLQTNLFSIKQHMKFRGCYFYCIDNTATLAFPSKIISVNNGEELTIDILPSLQSTAPYIFNQDEAELCKSSSYKVYNIIPTEFSKDPSVAIKNGMEKQIRVKRVTSTGYIPKETSTPGGFHVCNTHKSTLKPSQSKKIYTGIACDIPKNTHLEIVLSSSLQKRNITSVNPSFTSDDTGELIIELLNDSYTPIKIKENTKITTLIFKSNNINYSTHHHQEQSQPIPSKPKLQVFRLTKDKALLINARTLKSKRVTTPQTELFSDDKNDEATIKITTINDNEASPINPFLQMQNEKIPESTKQKVESLNNPSITPNEKVPSSSPQTTYLTRDNLLQSIGFIKPDNLIKNFNKLAKETVRIQPIPKRDDIDPGETASMHAPKMNKEPLQPPTNFGEVLHSDIGFGPVTAIGGVKYCMNFVDKATRKIYCYPLKTLKDKDLIKVHRKLINDMGFAPKLIRTDYDKKLFQGKVEEFLSEQGTRIETAPPRRQDKNGLVERTWQTVVKMARNWLVSAQLPSKYWWFAIKRACKIRNIMPTKHLNTITTPHELVYGDKVDYRQLFPMFSTAYIRYAREDGEEKNKWQSKTLKCILVGTSSTSDGLLFYHPPSKQIITCGDGYKLDTFSPAGPQFEEKYDGGFIFNTKGDEHHFHRPPSHELSETKFILKHNIYTPVKILNQPIDEERESYIVQEEESGDITEVEAENIFDADPTTDPTTSTTTIPFPHHHWIKHQAKATLFLNDRMKAPKQGKLLQHNKEWSFQVGRNNKGEIIPLQNFEQLASSLFNNKKLFQGWKRTSVVVTARTVRATSNLICRHVKLNPHISAKDLEVLKAPTLLQHKKLSKNDKDIWDKAYDAEYYGLLGIDTWEMITEDEYEILKKTMGAAMPTMAISTIKYDENGKPKRAKYRIVALGNLDPYPWSESDCFAPVLSQPEMRLLVSLAAKLKVVPKNADVSQAFCQSYLPKDEPYVLKPPPGCPRTPKGMYWKLKKTLYGLKRSPRHWYDLACKTLTDMGLKQNPHTPCIFVGRVDRSLPPIYIGIYVDDLIYFSESPETEKLFEKKFQEKLPCSFNDQIDHFLGIKFTCQKHDDGNVSIYLNQPAFIENLLEKFKMNTEAINTVKTPFRSGYVVDNIPKKKYSAEKQKQLTQQMQELVGSLNWLAISTRPDLSTIVNLLAKYMGSPSSGHLEAAKRVLRYLKGTADLGISFHSRRNDQLEAFLKFPLALNIITSFADANWGPQDASVPKKHAPAVSLELFKSRSLSGFLIWHTGPVHWVSKRQTITARSSAEAEIYATDECCKVLQNLSNIIDGMGLKDDIMKSPTIIYNDNNACVCWSKNLTTKGLRHIQIRENATREQIQNGLIKVNHIAGKINLSDFFTKEEKSVDHFIACRSQIMEAPPIILNTNRTNIVSPNNEQLNNRASDAQEPGGYRNDTESALQSVRPT